LEEVLYLVIKSSVDCKYSLKYLYSGFGGFFNLFFVLV